MTNYLENLGLSVLEQGSIIHSRHKFCLPGVRMLGHAVSTSDTATFITHLPFLLVETSTGQSFCIVIKLYFEAFFLYWEFFLVRKSPSSSDMFEFVHMVPYFLNRCTFICILLSALKQPDGHIQDFFFPFNVRTVEKY